jgi:hypothetical protein
MKLKCDCCGIEREFTDGDEAFAEGWDAPPHLTGYVTCDLCPASTQFMEGGWAHHAPIHEQWERDGRPSEFSQDTCILPEDRVPEETIALIKQIFGAD